MVVRDSVNIGISLPSDVLAVYHLSHQIEVVLHLVSYPSQHPHEAEIQHIRRIQPQSVDIELLHPVSDDVRDIPLYLRVLLVEPDEQVISSPVVIRESVIIAVVASEVHPRVPAQILRILSFLLNIPESKEIPAGVVEHSVKDHPDPLFMAFLHEVRKICVGPESAVQLHIICGLVPVSHRLEQRAYVYAVEAHIRNMGYPRVQLLQSVYGLRVIVFMRATQQPEGINVIEYRFIVPSHLTVLLDHLLL